MGTLRYYVIVDGQEMGPFEQGELQELLSQGAIDRSYSLRPEDGGAAVCLSRLIPGSSQASSIGIKPASGPVPSEPEYPAVAAEEAVAPASLQRVVRLPVLAGSGFVAALAVLFFVRRNTGTFFDGVDLVIHEAGHVVFSLGGDFLQFAGGTLLQLLAPIAFGIYFLRRAKVFSVQFCLLWLGQSLLNVARYVADARAMQLPLVGGGIHDWNYMLGQLGLLRQDTAIAGALTFVAVLAFVLAVAWPWVAPDQD